MYWQYIWVNLQNWSMFIKSSSIIGKCMRNLATIPFHHVPIVVQQTGKGERAFDIYSRLLKERIICLMGPINDATSSVTIAQLLYLQSESTTKPIHMYINSPGGVITSGLGIYDTMQYVMPPISTWCVGQCCSMASLLLAAGTKGKQLPHFTPHISTNYLKQEWETHCPMPGLWFINLQEE